MYVHFRLKSAPVRYTLVAILFTLSANSPVVGQRSFEEVGDSLYARFANVDALDAYRRAMQADSSFTVMFKRAVAANEIAQDLQAEGRRDESEEMSRTAVLYAEQVRDRYPDEAGSWFILAATTGKMAQFAGGKRKVEIGRKVEDYYQRAIDIDSTFAMAYMVGGIFNREVAQLNWLQRLAAKTLFGGVPNGSLEESRRLLEKAVELDASLFLAHWELAQTYEAMGMTDRARSQLRFLTVLTPRNSEEARIRVKVRGLLQAAKPVEP